MLATPPQPHDVSLPRFPKHNLQAAPSSQSQSQSPWSIAQDWLSRFDHVLASKDASRLSTVMHTDSWWRDHLVFDWDLHTLHGLDNISAFLSSRVSKANPRLLSLKGSGHYAPSISTPIPGLDWVQSMFDLETDLGKCRGFLRLAQGPDGIWKAHIIYTALEQLKGFEEHIGPRRAHGGRNSLKDGPIEGNWSERRQRRFGFTDEEPQTLIIGAGQAGLNLGARLQALSVSTLIIDKQKRIGDNWRHRYRTLVTHDPVTYAHMAYLPFPQNWPLYTPKDKLGDWFEAYASLMELNVWLSTSISSSTYSESEKRWTVRIRNQDGSERTLRPHHVVLCTGHSGEPRIPSFPGQDTFSGTLYHGSAHKDASDQPSVHGKKVVVVGTGNSGHDIAQNYYEHGAKVTMLQRSGTYVLQAEKGGHMLHAGTYDETGPPTEDADIFSQSLPMPVQFTLGVGLTQKISEAEKENLEGLKKAGFEVDFGHDGSGLFRKYMSKGGGYYIDVGASRLICEGKIKVVRSPEGISGFEPRGLVLADGRRLNADIVVLATGYDNMRTSLRKILGDSVADRANDVWGLDDEGELNGIWRPSGHPRFWYMGGNLALCRIYSRFLALQIKAAEEGISGM